MQNVILTVINTPTIIELIKMMASVNNQPKSEEVQTLNMFNLKNSKHFNVQTFLAPSGLFYWWRLSNFS